MARRTDCIFCGKETGSREHTFPAALGGRRENKGILCEGCNNGFSHLDGLLAARLSALNGLIGVRGDREDVPRLAKVEHPSEGILHADMTGRLSRPSPKVIAEAPLDETSTRIEVAFANLRQYEDWRQALRREGKRVRVHERKEVERYFDANVRVNLSFDGDENLRSIGRIALNFFATLWPDDARSPALESFKSYIKKGKSSPGDGAHVFWTPAGTFPLPAPANPFAHRILFIINGSQKTAYARVCLFNAYDFVVQFGVTGQNSDACKLITIDPLAEHAQDGVDVSVCDLPLDEFPCSLPPGSIAISKATAEMSTARVAALFEAIRDRQWTLGTAGLVDKLNLTRSAEPGERLTLICEQLKEHEARLYRLMTSVSDLLRERHKDSDLLAFFDWLTALDGTQEDGLSTQARGFLQLAVRVVSHRLTERLNVGELTEQELRELLDGVEGIRVVGTLMSEGARRIFAEDTDA